MLDNGVSPNLRSVIQEFMNMPELKEFSLGGGTNLAVRYNHRVSIDIDLFSKDIIGINAMEEIVKAIEKRYSESQIIKKDFNSNQYAWISGFIKHNGSTIKLDIIQNLKLLYPIQEINGIRMISERDIASLKLESAANRGSRKDFYDLFLLLDKVGINQMYSDYLLRKEKYIKKTDFNIFSRIPGSNAQKLNEDLTPLINFNHAKDLKVPTNQIQLTTNSPTLHSWSYIQSTWEKKVRMLGENNNLKINQVETIPARRKRGFGF